jgi:hypothetical protein
VRRRGMGRGKGGEMTQMLYAHMNKKNKGILCISFSDDI